MYHPASAGTHAPVQPALQVARTSGVTNNIARPPVFGIQMTRCKAPPNSWPGVCGFPTSSFQGWAGLLPRFNEFSQMLSQFWLLSGIEQFTEPFQIFFALFAQGNLPCAPVVPMLNATVGR